MGRDLDEVGKHLITVRACKGKGELSPEESVRFSDIEALPCKLHREIPFSVRNKCQRRRKLETMLFSDPDCLPPEVLHHSCGEHMHPEKAQVVASPQPGDYKLLLSQRRSRLFDYIVDFEKRWRRRHPGRSHCSVIAQLAFVSRTNG